MLLFLYRVLIRFSFPRYSPCLSLREKDQLDNLYWITHCTYELHLRRHRDKPLLLRDCRYGCAYLGCCSQLHSQVESCEMDTCVGNLLREFWSFPCDEHQDCKLCLLRSFRFHYLVFQNCYYLRSCSLSDAILFRMLEPLICENRNPTSPFCSMSLQAQYCLSRSQLVMACHERDACIGSPGLSHSSDIQ